MEYENSCHPMTKEYLKLLETDFLDNETKITTKFVSFCYSKKSQFYRKVLQLAYKKSDTGIKKGDLNKQISTKQSNMFEISDNKYNQ